MGEQPAGDKPSWAVEVAGASALLAEHTGFIFPHQQTTRTQFLMWGGGGGGSGLGHGATAGDSLELPQPGCLLPSLLGRRRRC